MSDYYEGDYGDYDDEEYLDYEAEDGHGAYGSDEEETAHRAVGNEESDDEDGTEPKIIRTPVVDLESLLCKEHGLALSRDCGHCQHLKAIVPDVLSQLGVPSEPAIPDARTWFGGKPETQATLVLPLSSRNYGETVYRAGPLKPASKFYQWSKDFLQLPPEDNTALMVNLGVEKMLEDVIEEFKGIKEWKDILSKSLRNNRIAHSLRWWGRWRRTRRLSGTLGATSWV